MVIDLPQIIAHRGARGSAPENTLAAMRQAQKEGAQWVEFDVMLTADGEPVVIHDNNVKRTTNGRGEVGLLNYETIKQLDAGAWYSAEFVGERIPHLVDMIHCLQECQLGANIEIKPYPGQERQAAITTGQVVRQHWPSSLPAPLLSSFSLESLRTLRKQDDKVLLGLLLHRWQDDWRRLADELSCSTVHLSQLIATHKRVQQIKATDRLVLCYTVNRVARAKRLFSWGVDAVFSDYPQRLIDAMPLT